MGDAWGTGLRRVRVGGQAGRGRQPAADRTLGKRTIASEAVVPVLTTAPNMH